MATLHLENLPPELLTQIEQLASQNQCSVDQQAIALLQQSLHQQPTPVPFLISPETDPTWSQRCKAVPSLQAEIDRHPRLNPTDFGLPDSTELIREDRQR